MAENKEETKGPAAASATQVASTKPTGPDSYLCVKDGRDHGHVPESATWGSVLAELGPRGDIKSSELREAIGDRSGLITNNDPAHLPSMLFD